MLRFTRGFLLCRLTLRVHTAVPLSVSSITRLPGGLGEVFRNLNEVSFQFLKKKYLVYFSLR